MTLSKKQIDQLFLFTEKKLVRYYDVQVELVDHLATRIEEEMEADKNLGFELALQRVYAAFGIFGFAHVVQEKQNALQKRSFHLWMNELKSFVTFPKVIFTLTLFLAAFYLAQSLAPTLKYAIIVASYLVFSVYQFYLLLKAHKVTTKKILLLQVAPVGSAIGPCIIFEHFLIFRQGIQSDIGFAIVAVIAYILQAAVIEVSKKVRQQAEELYPEAFNVT